MPFTRHLAVSPGITEGVNSARFAMGAAAVVLGVSVLAGCTSARNSTSTTPTSNPTGPIIIGASLSLSPGPAANPDPFQADGLAFDKGYHLWANDVNAHGGLLGRQVVLKIMDDGGLTNKVVTNYQTLLGKDHVDLAFGPFSSLLSAPAFGGGGAVRLRVRGRGGWRAVGLRHRVQPG